MARRPDRPPQGRVRTRPRRQQPRLGAWPGSAGQSAPRTLGHVATSSGQNLPPSALQHRPTPTSAGTAPRGSSRESSPNSVSSLRSGTAASGVLGERLRDAAAAARSAGGGGAGTRAAGAAARSPPPRQDPRLHLVASSPTWGSRPWTRICRAGLAGGSGGFGSRDFTALLCLCHRSATTPAQDLARARVPAGNSLWASSRRVVSLRGSRSAPGCRPRPRPPAPF